MTTAPSPSRAQLRSPRGPQKACRGVTTPGPHMVSPWGPGWHGAEGSFGGASWPACGNETPVHSSVPRENSGAAGPRVWSVPERACSCPVTFFQEPCTCSLPAALLGPSPMSFTCSQLTAGDLTITLSSFLYKHLPPGRCGEKADVGTGGVVPLENRRNHQGHRGGPLSHSVCGQWRASSCLCHARLSAGALAPRSRLDLQLGQERE